MPLMFITFNFNYIDKSILSTAAVFGLVGDTVCIFRPWIGKFEFFGFGRSPGYKGREMQIFGCC